MRLLEDGMSVESFNPNVHFGVTTYSDKFPFATAFLISFATEVQTSNPDLIRMAFADSTLRNMEKYSDNMRNWSTRMSHPSISYIMDNSDIAKRNDAQARFDYVDQSFTSKRYGKTRYLDTLNNALEGQGMKFKPLTRGSKYICDKVGKEIKLLSDTNFQVCEKFGVYGEKKFMGRKYMGISRVTYILDKNKKVIQVYPKVKPLIHAKEVLDYLVN